MDIMDELMGILMQKAFEFLSPLGWGLVFLAGLIGALVFLTKTTKQKLIFFGSSLSMATTLFFLKGMG